MSLRSSHVVGDHGLEFGDTAVPAAFSLCHDHVLPPCPDSGLAPRAQAAREHRRRHIEHLLFEYQCIPGLARSVALTLLRDDLFRVCSGSDHAEALLVAAFPSGRIPAIAARACVVPFPIDPAAALGRMSPWHMSLQCLDIVAAFLLGVSSAVCTRQPPTASILARFRPPGHPSMHGCSAYGLGLILPRSACLRLIFFRMCPALCVGALWPTPAWVWRDVRSVFRFFTKWGPLYPLHPPLPVKAGCMYRRVWPAGFDKTQLCSF